MTVEKIIARIDPKTLHMREESHLNGGKDWFGYVHRCVEQPRLTRKDVYTRKDRGVKSEFRVDGEPVASLDAALDALMAEPSLSADETLLLRNISDEPTDYRKQAFSDDEHTRLVWHFLREKGLIDWNKGRCCRTAAGRAMIEARPK